MTRRRRSASFIVTVAVIGYIGAILGLWVALAVWADRALPATLLAFGPRWLAAVPLAPLALSVIRTGPFRAALGLLAALALSASLLMIGILDFRLGLHRPSGPAMLRLLIHNLGGGQVTATGLDRLMRTEGVDVAALQECPFYNNDPAGLGWHFYYGGDLCLVSRFPFVTVGLTDPDNAWRRGGREPIRFAIQAPTVEFQLLNVHFETIRGGLEALETGSWRALRQFAWNRRTAMLDSRAARQSVRQVSGPLLVAGDFNLPVESAIYRENWGDLTNTFSSCGRGFGHTKFTSAFGIRIDHVLASAEWDCVDARVLQSPYGGDHAPVLVDLRLH